MSDTSLGNSFGISLVELFKMNWALENLIQGVSYDLEDIVLMF
jgi:hypothetical protein